MKEKVQNFISSAKGKVAVIGTTVATTMMVGVNAFAADEYVSAVDYTQMSTAVKGEWNAANSALLPVGIMIFVGMLAYTLGPKIIKRWTRQA